MLTIGFQNEADPTGDTYRAVMLAVIGRAVEDLSIPHLRGKAIEWAASPDLEEVCAMAGVDPDTIRRRFNAVAKGAEYLRPRRQSGRNDWTGKRTGK